MNVIYLSAYFLFTCLPSYFAISIDYYYDEDDIESNNTTSIKPNYSISINKTESKTLHITNEDENIKIYNYILPTINDTKTTIMDNGKDDKIGNYENKRKMFSKPSDDINSILNADFNIFDEYQYEYDNNTFSSFLARDSKVMFKKKTKTPVKNFTVINKLLNKQKFNHRLIDFYNLDPATVDIYEDDDNVLRKTESNVWYVPEDLPCWLLPLLYGELGYKEKSQEVFSIYRGYLKNVIHEKKEVKNFFQKTPSFSATYLFNKWCGVEPCYGDHTLCLFPLNKISNICDKGYVVKAPSISEQVALISTINSMRNQIASGESSRYSRLPSAANMKQIMYDYDLEKMALAWLNQCLPGPAPCSALEGNLVTQLECTKYLQQCCVDSLQTESKCTPLPECLTFAVIGCIYVWYWSAGSDLIDTDIKCGHIEASTFNTVQLLWANTNKIGCAFGENQAGKVRVVCNFAPGAPFILKTNLYCGILAHKDWTHNVTIISNIMDFKFLSSLGIKLDNVVNKDLNIISNQYKGRLRNISKSYPAWGVESLSRIYPEGWARKILNNHTNGTTGMLARVVTKYTFFEESESRCDTDEPIYVIGKPGSLCMERSRRYPSLCYNFDDPTPGYRLVAILVPMTLFSFILYDLFSGVVRQT